MTTMASVGGISERTIRRLRLGSGLILFLFTAMHLSNHVLGLLSIEAADQGRRLFAAIWRTPPGTLALYGSVLVHMVLSLRGLYVRRSLVMPFGEAMQVILGLAIPLLILDHVIATRLSHMLFNYVDNYETVIHSLWILFPGAGLRQAVALLVIWVHGCIGLHFWLRYRDWYPGLAPLLLALALILPVLSLLGFADMGRTLADPEFQRTEALFARASANNAAVYLNPEIQRQVASLRGALYGTFSLSLLIVLGARILRHYRERIDQITVHYQNGETVRVPRGFSVLEASRLGGIPHYSACGGKGQCSTCRVQVISDYRSLPPPDKLERSTLKRIGAASDVRLACQMRPDRDVTVAPLLVAAGERGLPQNAQETAPGREVEIAVLFCDLRNFTRLTEHRLPFDIVFLLNRYFGLVGRAVEEAGGRLDKFIGDGAMALFGLGSSPEQACRQALTAASAIAEGIEALGNELAGELTVPLEIAIGIHWGPAVVGTMGFGRVRSLTAVGDTVNVASRLETAAKEFEVALVVSEPVARLAGLDVDAVESREISLRGKSQSLTVLIVPRQHAATLKPDAARLPAAQSQSR